VWTHEALVVRVGHDHDSDTARRETPRRLPGLSQFVVLVLLLDVEHFTEILAQLVRGSSLDGPVGSVDVAFDALGEVGPCEPFTEGLPASDGGDGE